MKYKKEIEKTISLYANSGWKKWFAKIRFEDAPYEKVMDLIPKNGQIVELGCGEGVFTNFMGISSSKRKIIGVEIDKTRFSQADKGLKNVKFIHNDAVTYKIPKSDCIVLFHLLHHLLSFKMQEKLLINCYKALKKGGKLIIVEVDIKPTFKYAFTWITDHFLVPWVFEKRLYSRIFFRKKAEWKKHLEELGFTCDVTNAEQSKPFTHVIINCTKR